MSDTLDLQRRLGALLFLPSRAYAWGMRLRRQWYERGALESHRPPRPCVSIGNIGWGGSGKTPLTEWLLRWAARRDVSAVVLTRGYRATPPHPHYLVTETSTPREAGDEPLLLARSCPDGHVVVDPMRSRAAQWAWAELRPELFLLDDGFQHLKVQRDIDLVLLRPKDLNEEWDRVIPAGSWREDESALTRATAFLIKCSADEFLALEPLIRARLARFNAPVFNFSFKPLGVKRLDLAQAAESFHGEPYLLVTGVGEPDQVVDTAEMLLGNRPELHLRYDDHHDYSQADWTHIRAQADLKNISHILCTAKDAVKLARYDTRHLWTFDHTLEFGPTFFAETTFPDWWGNWWDVLRHRD
ncbi:tetraacyldisaccharide 4'-kinase [Desulfobaculum xiamenense]|uniref:Tetraacyldisaccharide 4'-kinase n=1 Tax=Desulfobaculum xiamenense TaxID=995050 RepID=A0A846QRW0_9BACT|nr:tetraacyldisaccharide 4'-kinase [Desulfobaculum xiamenense]NJB69103.1 tetraacyldisaccharide 4'-kinase [Desulfobaculum xiamenense]